MSEETYQELIFIINHEEIVSTELTREEIIEIYQEIERLNNILDELEKFTDEKIQKNFDECYLEKFNAYIEFNKKIKELRGGKE